MNQDWTEPQQQNPPFTQQPPVQTQATNNSESDKSYIGAIILSFLLGHLGIDRFYLGYVPTGILKLLTAGGLGIWSIIDFVRIVFGGLRPVDGKYLQGYARYSRKAKLFLIPIILIVNFAMLGFILLLVMLASPALQNNNNDTMSKNDMQNIAGGLASYKATTGKYPSVSDYGNRSFITTISGSTLDPSQYEYSAIPDGCDNITTDCTSYSLKKTLRNGEVYTVTP